MGELLSMIAHQWKQPLNVLAILNQSVHFKYHKNKLDDDFIDYFHKNSQKQINHMSNTIDDFSNFFKPEKEKTHFCINKTIEHILEMINPVFIKNNIDIEVDTKDEFIIKGYQNELGQAILNIINNAKDALLEKDLQNKKIEISLKQSDNNIELTISDNAGGIPDELIQKIFEPYFSTKNEKKGTGIGLYMTKIIIEDHMKGKLIVQNGENGAIFCIELPITEEK
jgi:signal transduction histidine kinase